MAGVGISEEHAKPNDELQLRSSRKRTVSGLPRVGVDAQYAHACGDRVWPAYVHALTRTGRGR